MKIHQCVLMDNVTVQDGVTLQNTVVSPHAIVQVCALDWLVHMSTCGGCGWDLRGVSYVVALFVLNHQPTGVLQPNGRVCGLLHDGAA